MLDDDLTGLDDARRGRLPRPRRSLSSRGAIYHLSVRTSSRAKGQSARAAAAYIQRTAEYSRDQGEELVYTESGHMPAWAAAEPTAYWDAADLYERANGRLCKTLEFALPLALSAAERRELAVGFAHHLTDGERLPYTLAIHAGAGTNPHCHLLISERGNDGVERSPEQWFKRYNAAAPAQGGARKSTALHPKAWLEETRAVWAEQTNHALELAGHAVRIDHRSLEAQDAARVPSVKLGPTVQALEAAGFETERGAEYRWRAQVNAELAELTRAQEEVEHERTKPEPERGVDGPAPGSGESPARARDAPRGRGSRVGRGAEAGRAPGDDAGPPNARRPDAARVARPRVGPTPGVGAAARGQADDPGADLAGGDAAGVERSAGGHPGGRGAADARDPGDAGLGAVAERGGVTRWRERIAAARDAAQAQERKEREHARQARAQERERKRERERGRERDEGLER